MIINNVLHFQQRGIALIIVLFMFAILAIVISWLVVMNSTDINKAKSYFSSEQAYLYCLSGEEIARQLLIEDFNKNPNIDHINESWAKPGYIYRTDEGYFEVFIEDASGRFNLNNLASPNAIKHKIILSNMLNLVIDDQSQSSAVAEQMLDWIDADKVVGTEEFDYLSEDPSYRPPEGPIADVSEIRWLKDVDRDVYKAIHDDLFSNMAAIPAVTKYNINTITPGTLAALTNTSINAAEEYVKNIRSSENGFSTPAQAITGISGADLSLLDVKSDYFYVQVRAKHADHYAYLTSLVFRNRAANGKIEIISRDRSKKFIFPFSEDYNDDFKYSDYEIDI